MNSSKKIYQVACGGDCGLGAGVRKRDSMGDGNFSAIGVFSGAVWLLFLFCFGEQ